MGPEVGLLSGCMWLWSWSHPEHLCHRGPTSLCPSDHDGPDDLEGSFLAVRELCQFYTNGTIRWYHYAVHILVVIPLGLVGAAITLGKCFSLIDFYHKNARTLEAFTEGRFSIRKAEYRYELMYRYYTGIHKPYRYITGTYHIKKSWYLQ